MQAVAEALALTPYAMLGEAAGVRRLCERFYAIMDEDERAAELRAVHAADLVPMTAKLASFLNAWLGGPRDYFDRPDAPCMMSVHKRFPIGVEERDQWLYCMGRALEACGASAEVRAMIEPAFARLADAMRSR
jgi:hemoglobin